MNLFIQMSLKIQRIFCRPQRNSGKPKAKLFYLPIQKFFIFHTVKQGCKGFKLKQKIQKGG